MCEKAVDRYPLVLVGVSDHLKSREICNKAVGKNSCLLLFVPDRFKQPEMCNEAVRNWPWPSFILNHLRTQETCNKIMHAMPDVFH